MRGTVADPDNIPVADASVWLSEDRNVRKTTTDSSGAFSFGPVSAGMIEIAAYKSGYALGGTEGYLIEDMEIGIVLRSPETIRLRAVDKSLQAIEGAYVVSLFVDDRFHIQVEDLVPHGFPSRRSDASGLIEIDYIPRRGGASVTLAHRRYAHASLPTLPSGSILDVPLSSGLNVRGRVVDESGRGVEHTRVSVFRIRAGKQQEFDEPITDREGFYAAVVSPAEYYVAARHRAHGIPQPVKVNVRVDGENRVSDIILPAPRALRGSVADTDGEPVPRAKVAYLRDDVVYAETVSDHNGNYELVVGSGPGILRVTPPPRMIITSQGDVRLNVGTESVAAVEPLILGRLPDIRGRVIAPEGVRLDKILIATANVHPMHWGTPSEDGSFVLPLQRAPREGKVLVRAEHALRFLRGEVVVDLANNAPVELRLSPFEPNLRPAAETTSNSLHHMIGEDAPEIECDEWLNLKGNTDREAPFLKNLRGKVVVLTLWGGFDTKGPGRARIEEMRALDHVYGDIEDVAIVSVHDAGLEPPDILDYVIEYNVEFPVCCDKDPFLTFDLYNTNVIPQTVLIDKKGVLRYFDVDGRLPELIKDLLRKN